MARLNSFYLPAELWPVQIGDTALLKGDEARHMFTVLRTETDQTVRLFDGQGRDGLFIVKEITKKHACLEAFELNEYPASAVGVTLAIGWGKSKRRNYLFEKVVELRGHGVVFWSARRSQGHPPDAVKEAWHEKVVQASKQCCNPHLPTISTLSEGLNDLVGMTANYDQCYLAWESDAATQSLCHSDLSCGKSLIVIGPEGGLDEQEAHTLIEAGFLPVTLGSSILRWETAATYCLSLGWYAQQEMK